MIPFTHPFLLSGRILHHLLAKRKQLYLALLLLVLVSHQGLMAQEEGETLPAESDTTTQKSEKEKVKKPWRPQLAGIRVGADVSRLAVSLLSDQQQAIELNGELLIDNQFFLIADFANASTTRFDEPKTYEYETSGNYWRAGLDYNVLHSKTDDHAVVFGIRYAQSQFSQQLDYTLSDFYYGDFNNSIREEGLSARWAETIFSIKYMILPNLYLASVARIKYRIGVSSSEQIDIGEAPGYGNVSKPNRVEVNYSLLYRIPFPKKKRGEIIKVLE